MVNKRKLIFDITMAGLSAAIICVCSFITIPVLIVPFTLQTFAIFLILYLFDLKVSLLSISVYLILGIIGVPVFSSFRGGIGVIMGPTGGYLIGFIFMPLIYYLSTKIGRYSFASKIIGLSLSLIFLYIFGSLWFYFVYLFNGEPTTFINIISLCIIPFIGPDIIKGTFAVMLGMQLEKVINKKFA